MSATKSERVSSLERLLPSILLGVSVALLLAGGVRQKGAAVRQESLNEAIRNQISMQVEVDAVREQLRDLNAKLEVALRSRRTDSAPASLIRNMPK